MFMTNEKIFSASLYFLGLVLWYVLWKLFSSVAELAIPYQTFAGMPITSWMGILALALSFGAVQFSLRNQKIKDYGMEVIVEMKKVTFPNRRDLQGATLVVILMTLLVTTIIWVFDKIFDFVIKLIF